MVNWIASASASWEQLNRDTCIPQKQEQLQTWRYFLQITIIPRGKEDFPDEEVRKTAE